MAAGAYAESVTLNRFVRVSLDGDAELSGDLSISAGTFDASGGNLVLQGDFAYSGGMFDPGHRSVTFDGSGTQTISGDAAFWDVAISSSVVLETSDDVTVGGTLTNLGVTRETKAISGTETIAFGLADVTIDVTEPGLTAMQVERRDESHPDAPVGIQTGRYWNLTPTGSDYTLSLTLPHNGVPGACDEVCRYTGCGELWDCASNMYDRSEGTITRLGVTHLSDWATGDDVGPCHLALPMVLH